MAKSAAERLPQLPAAGTRAGARAPAGTGGYFPWSREPAVSLLAVLPLWLCYEVLRFLLAPEERNGAEALLRGVAALLGAKGLLLLRLGFAVAVFAAMRSVLRREVPWARVLCVIALEGMVYGLLLGPIAGALAAPATHLSAAPVRAQLVQDLVASLGAGIFEELLFRLGLMSLLVWLWLRTAGMLTLPRWLGGVAAAIGSALTFAWFHHYCGEPYDRAVFLFRVMAGVILGFLFWFRGYGVCVYTHAMYDVYLFLTQHRA